MKIVHVTPYYAPAWAWGGVVEAVSGLARAQAAAGHRVAVVTTDTLGPFERGPSERRIVDGVDVVRVRTRSPWLRGALNLSWPVGFGAATRACLEDLRPAVVHCHELRTVETLVAACIASRLTVPIVLSPHGTLPYLTGRRWAKYAWDQCLARTTLERTTHVVALTRAEAAEVAVVCRRWRVPRLAGRCSVVQNGVDVERYGRLPGKEAARRRLGLPLERPVALFLGRLDARKGVDLLVEAGEKLAAGGHPVHLLIAGPDAGVRRAVEAQVSRLGCDRRVSMPGLLVGDTKLAALAAADVMALPSYGEGLPMAVLEALAAGVPVVAARETHLDGIERAGAGLLVDRTADSLAGGLLTVVRDHARRAEMARRARTLAAERHGWQAVIPQLDRVYEQCAVEGVAR